MSDRTAPRVFQLFQHPNVFTSPIQPGRLFATDRDEFEFAIDRDRRAMHGSRESSEVVIDVNLMSMLAFCSVFVAETHARALHGLICSRRLSGVAYAGASATMLKCTSSGSRSMNPLMTATDFWSTSSGPHGPWLTGPLEGQTGTHTRDEQTARSDPV